MKKTSLLLTVALVALTGCNKPAPAPQNTATVETEVATDISGATAAANCPDTKGYNPFPDGLAPEFAYHLRSDRIYTHKNDRVRRRVTMEVLESDAASALVSLQKNLTDIGYKERQRSDGNEGRVSVHFSKARAGSTILTADSSPGSNPSNPKANGIISIDFAYTSNMDGDNISKQ
ncbi:lipoprotein [Marilutibacter alkalisoli]|uniref:Type IV secretion system putative lipoprotein virB7 n=1 Tax=Marilutibacter alkalisoli TaxID=2591633 RepID=A0A514BUD6_9GAMM|nr:lipoprotein [Lysobacter alkalisoli]QDH71028.1 hypothetical protein FKV23_13745 [Lysobacter alkalisoli]